MKYRFCFSLFFALACAYGLEAKQVIQKDALGNDVTYSYSDDDKHLLLSIVYPPVLDENGNAIKPVFTYEYDALGNVTTSTDPKGYVTRIIRDSKGHPIQTIYPDGSIEYATYNEMEQLVESTAKNGMISKYSYDYSGRIGSTEVFSPSGTLLNTFRYTYNGQRLATVQDQSGLKVSHEYLDSGVIGATIQSTPDGTRKKGFVYDDVGHLEGVKEWFGPGEEEFSLTTTRRNEKESIVEVNVEDAFGHILKSEDGAKPSQVNTLSESTIKNQLGQVVLRKIVYGPSGDIKETIHDALARPESIYRWDSNGSIICHEKIFYDLNGNKTRHVFFAYDKGKLVRNYELAWEYGPMNRLEAVIEEGFKRTVCEYNSSSRRVGLVKPDGVRISYFYDDMGRLASQTSSDGTISYRYTYDSYDHLVEVEDVINKTITKREYTGFNEIKSEVLGNGLSVVRSYDGKGRKTGVILPDSSSIEYVYDALYLTNIRRLDASGKKLYEHSYSNHSSDGQLIESKLIGDLGAIQFAHDQENRTTGIQTPFWSEIISDQGFDYKGDLITLSVKDALGSYTQEFKYDSQQQLISEEGLNNHQYVYDAIYNRKKKDENPCEINILNQVVAHNGAYYTYDANGNRIAKATSEERLRFNFDALNRLTKVVKNDNLAVEYTYDAFNRRLSRKLSSKDANGWNTLQSIRYLYDGDNEIGSVDSEGKFIDLRVLGDGLGAEIGAAVALEISGKVYAPIHDHRGSVVCLIDKETGKVEEYYRYSAFGEEQVLNVNGDKQTNSINPWRFASKRFDDMTGLVGFGKRDYDPSIGQWITPDPFGTIDAPNLYAFVQNNPVMRTDLRGTFSFVGALDQFLSKVANGCNSAKSTIDGAVEILHNRFAFLQYVADDLDQIAHRVTGKAYLVLSGYYDENTKHGIFGQNEISEKVRVTLINGMLNNHEDCTEIAKYISKSHGNVNVHYVFHATEGWTRDIFHGAFVKFGYISPQARLLAATWKRLIAEMGGIEGGGKIVHYAHSLGGTDTNKARSLLTETEQKMIRVFSFGSSTILENKGFENVNNYISVRDGVCWLDPVGYIAGMFHYNRNVRFVGTIYGIPLVDHLFSNESYRQVWEELGKEFCSTYTNSD